MNVADAADAVDAVDISKAGSCSRVRQRVMHSRVAAAVPPLQNTPYPSRVDGVYKGKLCGWSLPKHEPFVCPVVADTRFQNRRNKLAPYTTK